jgi:hypothetical protein
MKGNTTSYVKGSGGTRSYNGGGSKGGGSVKVNKNKTTTCHNPGTGETRDYGKGKMKY